MSNNISARIHRPKTPSGREFPKPPFLGSCNYNRDIFPVLVLSASHDGMVHRFSCYRIDGDIIKSRGSTHRRHFSCPVTCVQPLNPGEAVVLTQGEWE